MHGSPEQQSLISPEIHSSPAGVQLKELISFTTDSPLMVSSQINSPDLHSKSSGNSELAFNVGQLSDVVEHTAGTHFD